MDGNTVDSANYRTVPGSIVITLKKSYLDSGAVSVGRHTLTAYFSDGGTAETKLTVTSSGSGTTPGTGDDTKTNNLVSAMILFLLSLSFIAYTAYDKKFRAKLLAVPAGISAYFSGSSKADDDFDDDLPAYDDGFDDDFND